MIDNLIANLINLLSNTLPDNTRRALASDINDFVVRQEKRLRLTKNVLFRNEPIDFYESYIPLTVKNDSLSLSVSDPIHLLNQFKNIIIIGTAGSGKSTLLQYTALKCLQESYGIPLLVNLRNYHQNLTFEEFLCKQVTDRYASEVKSLFKKGSFVFILDGYDEIDYRQGSSLITQIDEFISRYHRNSFVFSSRPGTDIESLTQFYVFHIEPLNENDIYLYVEKLAFSNDLRAKIFNAIKRDDFYSSILTNPLFLSLYIYHLNIFTPETLDKKSVFFRNLIDFLFSKHDSVSKMGYARERLSGLDKDVLEKIAASLAFRCLIKSMWYISKDDLYREFGDIKRSGQLNFENEKLLYDLVITVNILIDDNNYYSFPHVLVLEYLASLFIARLHTPAKLELYKKIAGRENFHFSTSMLELLNEQDKYFFANNYLVPSIERMLSTSNRNNFSKWSSPLLDFLTVQYSRFIANTYEITIAELEQIYSHLKAEVATLNDDLNFLDVF
jgi:hypothetical protein